MNGEAHPCSKTSGTPFGKVYMGDQGRVKTVPTSLPSIPCENKLPSVPDGAYYDSQTFIGGFLNTVTTAF